MLPYVAIVVAISVLVWALRNTFDTVEGGAAVIAVLITIVAMARQIAAMNETSRLREQQALQSSEERFERALRRTQFSVDHAADSMIWIDSGGRIVDVNPFLVLLRIGARKDNPPDVREATSRASRAVGRQAGRRPRSRVPA